ncbi:MAG: hypothetical protein M9887_11615 [Chitinophagales bacterium]|nr:hypothetical protein [Chitinophagales bacterium]
MKKLNIYFYLLSLSVLVSCGLIKEQGANRNVENTPVVNSTNSDNESVDSRDVNQARAEDENQIQIIKNVEDSVEENFESSNKIKDAYNVAVIFPLMYSFVPEDFNMYMPDTGLYLSVNMKEALDFYIGLKLAVEDIKMKDKNINFFILNGNANETETKHLLTDRPFPNIDLIISGTTQHLSNELLKYSKENNIPLISPYTTDIPLIDERFYAALPSYSRYIEYSISELTDKFPDLDIEIYQDANYDSSRIIVNSIKNYLADNFDLHPMVYQSNKYLYEDNIDTTVVYPSVIAVVASNKETIVKRFLSKLNSKKANTFIVGTPEWESFSGLKDYENLTIYIPTFAKSIQSDVKLKEFSSRVKNTFGIKENKNHLLGYDLSSYVISLLNKDKLNYDLVSTKDLGLNPYYYSFDFIPVTDNQGIRYFSNNQIKNLVIKGSK